jgi:hypothetical protein
MWQIVAQRKSRCTLTKNPRLHLGSSVSSFSAYLPEFGRLGGPLTSYFSELVKESLRLRLRAENRPTDIGLARA